MPESPNQQTLPLQFMKPINYILSFLIFIFACSEQNENETHNVEEKETLTTIWQPDTSLTVAEMILEIEAKAGFDITKSKLKLDTIFADCTKKNETDIRQFLENTHQCLNNHAKNNLPYSPLLSICLEYGFYDCDILSTLYLSLAQINELKIDALMTNEHVFLNYKDQKKEAYWETTTGNDKELSYYSEKYKISEQHIGKGRLLTPINKSDLIAMAYYNIALYYFQKQDFQNSANYIYSAIANSDEWCTAYNLLAQIFEQQELYNQAEIAYVQALELQPDSRQTRKLLKRLYKKLGCVEEMFRLQQ